MGGKTPETCWAVNKLQDNNWKIIASGWWFIWIVQWCTDLQTLNFIICQYCFHNYFHILFSLLRIWYYSAPIRIFIVISGLNSVSSCKTPKIHPLLIIFDQCYNTFIYATDIDVKLHNFDLALYKTKRNNTYTVYCLIKSLRKAYTPIQLLHKLTYGNLR